MAITKLRLPLRDYEIQDPAAGPGPGPHELAAPGSIVLLDDNGDVVGLYSSIQTAVDAAGNGYTLVVGEGTYTEQVTVDGIDNLTIRAETGDTVVIKAPAILPVNGVSDHFGYNVRANLAVIDCSGFTLEGIDIDGSFAGDTTGSLYDEFTGIALLNSSGSIDDADIFEVGNRPGQPSQFGLDRGSGLFIDNSGLVTGNDVAVTGSTISHFQLNGALIIGADITFTGNTITGVNANILQAQNCLQIALSTGVVSGNTLSNFGFLGGPISLYSSGVTAYEPSGPLAITGNTITGANFGGRSLGIRIFDVLGIAVDLTGNSFNSLDYGIYASTVTGGSVGLDADPDTGGNTYTDIRVQGVHFDPQESEGAPFTTATAFTESGSYYIDLLAGSEGDDDFSGLGGGDVLQGRGGNDRLDGGDGDDDVSGGLGNDVLNGGAGNDTLAGDGGNDAYIVEQAGDIVIEGAGGGYDTVYALASFELGYDQEVEVLTVYDRDTANAINLTGNNLANTIYGNQGSNVLNGGAGNDSLYGLGGNDAYIVEDSGDVVVEGAGGGFDTVYTLISHQLQTGQEVETLTVYDRATTNALNLTGNNLANAIYGNAGANNIDGKGGADTLYGMGGADTFTFTNAPLVGAADALADFSAANDTIALDDVAFLGIGGLGALGPDVFTLGNGASAASHRIVYNQATGQLFFDADGNGSGVQVQFATFNPGTLLGADDFVVI